MVIVLCSVRACPDYLRMRLADCIESFGKKDCLYVEEECNRYDAEKCVNHLQNAMKSMSKHCPAHIMEKEEALFALASENTT